MRLLKPQILFYVVGLPSYVLVQAFPLVSRGLFGTDWILSRVNSDNFSAAEKQVFQPKLASTGLKLGSPISQHGTNNEGIYTVSGVYQGHPGEQLLVKTLPATSEKFLGEVKVLKIIGDFVAAGMVKIKSQERPAVVMIKQPGEVLSSNEEYKTASKAEQLEMKTQAIDLMCKAVAELAVKTHIYRGDNNMGNALFQVKNKKVVSVALVDYGGAYNVAQGVKKEVVEAQCKSENQPEYWSLFWS